LIELLIVVAIIGIIAAIAIPGLLRARMAGNEASAIGSLRETNSGQAAYSSSCANAGYATTLVDLFLAPAGGTGFISPDLSTDPTTKSGYTVSLAAATKPAAAGVVTLKALTCNGRRRRRGQRVFRQGESRDAEYNRQPVLRHGYARFDFPGHRRSADRATDHRRHSKAGSVTPLQVRVLSGTFASAAQGSVTVNREPQPTPALSAVTLPPCSSTRFLTIPNPSPKPAVVFDSACRNGWNT
jgi:type II secretory pathway pseudopilin PulG